jgi:hypothetical protein
VKPLLAMAIKIFSEKKLVSFLDEKSLYL